VTAAPNLDRRALLLRMRAQVLDVLAELDPTDRRFVTGITVGFAMGTYLAELDPTDRQFVWCGVTADLGFDLPEPRIDPVDPKAALAMLARDPDARAAFNALRPELVPVDGKRALREDTTAPAAGDGILLVPVDGKRALRERLAERLDPTPKPYGVDIPAPLRAESSPTPASTDVRAEADAESTFHVKRQAPESPSVDDPSAEDESRTARDKRAAARRAAIANGPSSDEGARNWLPRILAALKRGPAPLAELGDRLGLAASDRRLLTLALWKARKAGRVVKDDEYCGAYRLVGSAR